MGQAGKGREGIGNGGGQFHNLLSLRFGGKGTPLSYTGQQTMVLDYIGKAFETMLGRTVKNVNKSTRL